MKHISLYKNEKMVMNNYYYEQLLLLCINTD